MTVEYTGLDAELVKRLAPLYEPPPFQPLEDAVWWTPDGIMMGREVEEWMWEQTFAQCPYYIKQTTGEIRDGVYGPGTCMGGCVDEPRCMT